MSDEDLRERKGCWFWHSWSGWSDPTNGRFKGPGQKDWEPTTIQSRACRDCNKQELRRVYG